jgi:hypothetical protein
MLNQEAITTKFYAGIGSRETPQELRPVIHSIAKVLDEAGYILRSGGADGADTFFEEAARNKVIYLPWPNFNGRESKFYELTDDAFELAKKHHPAYGRLSYGATKLMARNGYQVLGHTLTEPVDFVICWTKNGKMTGGTAQAMRIATDLNIPVFNLFDGTQELSSHLKEKGIQL